MAVTGVGGGGSNATKVAHLAQIVWRETQCVSILQEDSSNPHHMMLPHRKPRRINLQWKMGLMIPRHA